MHRRPAHIILALLGSAAALSLPATSFAQSPEPEGEAGEAAVQDIVVTARYRKEDAQKVPIAISAISGDRIAAQGAFNLKQSIQQLPSLNIQGFSGRNQTITIRGIGTNSGGTNDGLEQGVGLYVDGVYRPRTGSVITDLIDVESIQLLRGPQGTLLGKNTVAGAIDVKTRAPSFTNEARAEASYGNYDYARGYLSLNAALSDTLAVRLSYLRTRAAASFATSSTMKIGTIWTIIRRASTCSTSRRTMSGCASSPIIRSRRAMWASKASPASCPPP